MSEGKEQDINDGYAVEEVHAELTDEDMPSPPSCCQCCQQLITLPIKARVPVFVCSEHSCLHMTMKQQLPNCLYALTTVCQPLPLHVSHGSLHAVS